MKCSICGVRIKIEPISGWDQGNNAEPINNGRCCNKCNDIVIIRRINDMIESKANDKQASTG